MSGPYEVAHDLSPVLLSDTTLRDGTQRESLILSLGDKPRIAARIQNPASRGHGSVGHRAIVSRALVAKLATE